MKNFGQRDDNRGRFKSEGRNFGRSKFRSKGRHDRGPATMYRATCAECGKDCEVPFRPSGEKPVYCSECFENKRDGGDRAPRIDLAAQILVKTILIKIGIIVAATKKSKDS